MSDAPNLYVVGHAGRRDYYQVAVALASEGRLERLVTDFYCPDWLARFSSLLPARIHHAALRRRAPGLPSRLVSAPDSIALAAIEAKRRLFNRPYTLTIGPALGIRVARLAKDRRCGALVYGYNWEGFIRATRSARAFGPRVLIVSEPLPSQLRQALRADRLATGASHGQLAVERLGEAQVQRREAAFLAADGAIVPSSYVRDGLVARGMPADRIAVVPYGGDLIVRLDGAVPRPVQTAEPRGDLRLLWIGQPTYLKGPHHLAAALRLLGRTDIALTAVAYNRGPHDPFADLPCAVKWLPRVNAAELPSLFAAHDLLIFPSLAEAFGLVCVEALHAGLPVIATRRTGAPDVIVPGENGLLVEGGNTQALAQAIEQLADDRALLARLTAGAQASGSQWTWKRFRAGVIAALDHLEAAPMPKL